MINLSRDAVTFSVELISQSHISVVNEPTVPITVIVLTVLFGLHASGCLVKRGCYTTYFVY